MQTTMMDVPLSLNHLLDRAGRYFGASQMVSRRPDKSLVQHSHAQWFKRTRALAAALQALGLKKGDRVATLCWNHHAHLECYFGIPAAGGVMHTLNLRLAPAEIGAIAANAGLDERYRRAAMAGVPAPLVDLRINVEVSAEAGPAAAQKGGANVAPDGVTMGEVQVRGPFITGACHGVPPTSDKFTSDGFLRTGDVATIDVLGFVRITDRTKDLIKSGGEWISSVDLENALMAHPAIAEAAVIAIPDDKWSERPLACVVFKRGASATPQALNEHLLQFGGFAKWQLPERYESIAAVPRTSTGQFWKLKLREQFPR